MNSATIQAILGLISALAKIAADAKDPKSVPARIDRLWSVHRSAVVRAAEEDRVRKKFAK